MTKIRKLLGVAPRPLLNPDARMLVIFSAKSGCTSVVIWFLHQLGHAEAAFAYNSWPHRYRAEVYFKLPLYRNACELDVSDFAVVRVVRDPFVRAASSFRHALGRGLVDFDVGKPLERSDPAANGLSFTEFLDCLERMDLKTCNPHYRIQRHPIEDYLPVRHLINVSTDALFTRLNEVEADLGLPRTNFDELQWIHRLERSRSRVNGTLDTADAYALRLTQEAARTGPWPAYGALLTPAARDRIARLYAADIEAYQPSSAHAGSDAQRDRAAYRTVG